jgi:hypothetical protein
MHERYDQPERRRGRNEGRPRGGNGPGRQEYEDERFRTGGFGREYDERFERDEDELGSRGRFGGPRGFEAERNPAGFGGSEWRERFGGSDWEQPVYGGSDFEAPRRPFAGGHGGYGERSAPEQRFPSSSHAGKGPKGYRRADDRILEDVNQALERHPRVDASEIEVSCQSGEITLRGSVDSREAKRLAEQCIEDLPGVKDVRNELRVQQAGTAMQRDERTGRRGDRSESPRG